jgi:hypothetical protein
MFGRFEASESRAVTGSAFLTLDKRVHFVQIKAVSKLIAFPRIPWPKLKNPLAWYKDVVIFRALSGAKVLRIMLLHDDRDVFGIFGWIGIDRAYPLFLLH